MLPWDLAPHLPWQVFTSPVEQWELLPTLLIAEYVVIACAVVAFFHAWRAGRTYMFIWFAALLAGTANDLIFMALPAADNFWHAQTTIMLTPRLPLYIVCMYVLFLYWPTVAVRRLNLGIWSTSALTGLVACLLYAPYDIVGAKFIWWTWHDSDELIAQRLFGAPVSSSLWVLTFTGAFALLIGRVLRVPDVSWKRIAIGVIFVVCLATPLMVLQMSVLQILTGGVPGYFALGIGIVLYAALALYGLRAFDYTTSPVDWLGRGAVSVYLLMLALNMALFVPETHVSVGVHQIPGPCNIQDTDITGVARQEFLCVQDYDEDFTFDCATTPDDGALWYTVCGRTHTNYAGYTGAVGVLSLVGILVFSLLFGVVKKFTVTR